MSQRRRGRRLERRRVRRVRLGKVLHYVKTGHLVVETPGFDGSPPPLGSRVELPGVGVIGTLMDIIGPVEKPYAVVKLERGVDPSTIPAGADVEVVVEERAPAQRRRRPRPPAARAAGRRAPQPRQRRRETPQRRGVRRGGASRRGGRGEGPRGRRGGRGRGGG